MVGVVGKTTYMVFHNFLLVKMKGERRERDAVVWGTETLFVGCVFIDVLNSLTAVGP